MSVCSVDNDSSEKLPDLNLTTKTSSCVQKFATPERKATLSRNQHPDKCLVCHRPSTGYHYNVASCNGCKSFFRRTIVKGDKLVCRKRKSTELKHATTSIPCCRACRFEKCITAGMNPISIRLELSENSRMMIKEVMRKQEKNGIVQNKSVPASPLVYSEEAVNRVISKLSVVELQLEKIHDSAIQNGFCDFRSLEDILKSKLNNTYLNAPKVTKEESKNEFSPSTISAHYGFLASIEYLKTFKFYQKILLADKILLARHVTSATSILHDAYFSFLTMKSERLCSPTGVSASPTGNVGEKTEFWNNTLLAVLRNKLNRVEFMLLKAIVTCNPTVSCLSNNAQELLEQEKQLYACCLLQYCRLQYGASNGPSRYVDILSIVPIIENQGKQLKDLHTYIQAVMHGSDKAPLITNLFRQILDS